MKFCRLRPRAERDVDDAARHYAQEGGYTLGAGFYDAVESALQFMAGHPGCGSLRIADLLDVPGLRVWPVKKFPYLIFYLEREAYLDVVRILHQSMDVPVHLHT